MGTKENRLYKFAYQLSLFTILFNIIEGIVSMILGYKDETLTLFGFGADSFIEVMSGIGIAMMILRIKQYPESLKNYGYIILSFIGRFICRNSFKSHPSSQARNHTLGGNNFIFFYFSNGLADECQKENRQTTKL